MTFEDKQLTFSILHKEVHDCKLKFLNDKMRLGMSSGDDEPDTEVQGSIAQTWMADYPLIAYNSYLSDNSQIFLANLAEKRK